MPVTSRRPFLPASGEAGVKDDFFVNKAKGKFFALNFSFEMKAKQDNLSRLFLSTIFQNVP